MGDMADVAIQEAEVMEELRYAYHQGRMTEQEAYDAGIIDELGYEEYPCSGEK